MMNKEKKEYVVPEMELLKLEHIASLLNASDIDPEWDDDNKTP